MLIITLFRATNIRTELIIQDFKVLRTAIRLHENSNVSGANAKLAMIKNKINKVQSFLV